MPTSKWWYASLICANGEGIEVDFSAQHYEHNGAAMVGQKIQQSITKPKKKGQKCKHHLKNL